MYLLNKLIDWLRSVYQKRKDPALKLKIEEEIPVTLEDKTLYVIGSLTDHWAIALLCPCGCKQNIQLNTLPEAKPCWSFRLEHDGAITVHPSIWRKIGCKSHFHIRQGKIKWA
jgi:hypothetical protein